MEQTEGVFAVTFDDLLDPKTSKEGRPYWQLSVKRQGQGTGDMFVTEELYNKLKAARLQPGAPLALVYKLLRIRGSMDARLEDVVIL